MVSYARRRHVNRKAITAYRMPAWLLGLLGVALLWNSGLLQSVADGFFPLRFVRVEGNISDTPVDECIARLRATLGSGYLTTDVQSMQKAVSSIDWVASANVVRVWPDTISVGIVERDPVARWGDQSLISSDGKVFRKGGDHDYAYLPGIYGPPGQEMLLLEKLAALNALFSPHRVKVESLTLNGRLSWALTLTGGTEIVYGNQDPVELSRRTLGFLAKMGDQKSIEAIKKLDLRYDSGFAVVWKADMAQPEGDGQPDIP